MENLQRLVKKNRFYNKGDKNVKSTIVKWTSFRNDLCLISSRIFFSFWDIEIGKLFSWFSICFWSTCHCFIPVHLVACGIIQLGCCPEELIRIVAIAIFTRLHIRVVLFIHLILPIIRIGMSQSPSVCFPGCIESYPGKPGQSLS